MGNGTFSVCSKDGISVSGVVLYGGEFDPDCGEEGSCSCCVCDP